VVFLCLVGVARGREEGREAWNADIKDRFSLCFVQIVSWFGTFWCLSLYYILV